MVLVLLMYALFASVFTIAKVGLQNSQPLFFLGSRMFVAGVIMLCYVAYTQRESLKLNKTQLWKVAKLALINIYLTNFFELWGLQFLTSGKACFIYSLSPFLSSFFAYLIFDEKMRWKKWLGLAIGFAGLAPIFLDQSSSELLSGSVGFSLAELSLMMAVILSAYGWILLQQLVKTENFSPMCANGYSMLLGGLAALTHSFAVEDWNPLPVTNAFPFLVCSMLLLIISNLICYNLYGYLLKRFSVTFLSFAGFVTPFFAAFFGWLYLSETVSASFFLSGFIVLLGLLLFYQEELKRDKLILANN